MTTAIDIDMRGKVRTLLTTGTVPGPNSGDFFFYYIGKLLIFISGSSDIPTSTIYWIQLCLCQSSASFRFTFKVQAIAKLAPFSLDIFLYTYSLLHFK